MTEGMHMHSLAWGDYAFANVLYQYEPRKRKRKLLKPQVGASLLMTKEACLFVAYYAADFVLG